MGTLASGEPYYEITPIRTNPGIYYERIRPVRVQKGSWKIVIYLVLHGFLDVHGPNIDLDANYKRCAVHFDELRCDTILIPFERQDANLEATTRGHNVDRRENGRQGNQ